MKYSTLLSLAVAIVSDIKDAPPNAFNDLPDALTRAMNHHEVPFEERRYVCALIAENAEHRALGLKPPSSKLLRKVAENARKAHDAWADAGFFRRGSARRITQEELDMRRIRESTIADYVDGALQIVGAMRDVVGVNVHVAPEINATVVVPAEAVRKRVDAKPAEKAIEAKTPAANDAEAPAPAPSPAS